MSRPSSRLRSRRSWTTGPPPAGWTPCRDRRDGRPTVQLWPRWTPPGASSAPMMTEPPERVVVDASALVDLLALPLSRHDLPPLVAGAWARRADLRLLDALYVELAERLGVRVLTTDHRLARACPAADAITRSGPASD